MKRIIFAAAVMMIVLFLTAGTGIKDSPVTTYTEDLFIDIQTDIFGYSASGVFASGNGQLDYVLGARIELIDRVEITALPDTALPVSADNIPYVQSTVNLYAVDIPAGIIISKGNIRYWAADIFSTGSLYEASYFTNRVNAGMVYADSIKEISLSIYSLTGDLMYYSGSIYTSRRQSMEAGLMFNTAGFKSGILLAGVNIHAGHTSDMAYAIQRGKYGFTPCLHMELRGKLIAGIEAGGNMFNAYTGINRDNYSIGIRYSNAGGLSSVQLYTGIDF